MRTHLSYIIIIIFCYEGHRLCSQEIDSNLLKLGDKIYSSGKYLIDREYGLHPIRSSEDKIDTVFIAVHGYRSRGYEWVYALKKNDGIKK